jgi:hypothetical protein
MSKMKSGTLCTAALISLFTGGGIATTRAAQAPNIIIIMADDLTRAASSTGGRAKSKFLSVEGGRTLSAGDSMV